MIKILTRKIQDAGNLIPNETPRGQARLSVKSTLPAEIDSEVELVVKILDELDQALQQNGSKYFGTQLSIADILYYWEISTLQHMLKKEIVPANTALATWFHETMKSDEVRSIETKSLEALN